MKAPSIHDFSVLIGLDWADQKHDICELSPDNDQPIYCVISAKPKAIHEWAQALQQRFPNKPIAIACELTKGPIIYALSQYQHITLFSINPSTVAQYRKAFSHSGAKSDPVDALIQAEILKFHLPKLKLIKPDSAVIRSLGQTVEHRRKLVQERVKLSNRITIILKSYYPQVLDWFKEKDTVIFCDFIARWPSLATAKKARSKTLMAFFNQHNARYTEVNEQRILAIKDAYPLTNDLGVIEPNQLMISVLIPQLKLFIEGIETLDKAIKKQYNTLPDKVIFDSFPGAGPQLAPRLLVAFGSDRERYSTASEIQKYAGIAPAIEASGKSTWTHWRYSCPKFLRQTFVEWAGQSVRFSFWARAYYQQQIAKGKPHHTAIRSLAFKWIRIVFRCWKARTTYDESTYLEALKRRGSPLLAYAAKT